jgi:hypothetical protein
LQVFGHFAIRSNDRYGITYIGRIEFNAETTHQSFGPRAQVAPIFGIDLIYKGSEYPVLALSRGEQ